MGIELRLQHLGKWLECILVKNGRGKDMGATEGLLIIGKVLLSLKLKR
jgi:hypothetical protein